MAGGFGAVAGASEDVVPMGGAACGRGLRARLAGAACGRGLRARFAGAACGRGLRARSADRALAEESLCDLRFAGFAGLP
jgi:hypothetical protein